MSMDQLRADAAERLAILQEAREFDSLLEHPGGKRLYALHNEWVDQALVKLRQIDTQNPIASMEALHRWQLAESLLDLEAQVINNTLAKAKEIRGDLTLEQALLMEQVRNEQQSTTEPGSTDPAGY